MREENAALRAQIAWLKNKLFGASASETLERAQLLLQPNQLETLAAQPAETATETIAYERQKQPAEKRANPAETYAHLPVKETIEIIPEPVRQDPGLQEKIGEERTFEIDVIPPRLFKREIVRPKYRHALERTRAPILAPAPPRVVPGGYATAGLISWALTAKYCDHLPLYRQEKMLERWGAPITRQVLSDWTGAATALLEPLAKRLKADLLQSGYIQADDETRQREDSLAEGAAPKRSAGAN